MDKFEVEMQHTEESLQALSHMQYDLFCTKNRVVRSVLSLGFVILGVVYFSHWWGVLAIAYGCYLTTSTYASANHTAHKIAAQLKASGLPFPHSRYLFGKESIRVISLPGGEELDPLPYSKVSGLGEDNQNFYIFRDQYGGYVIPKDKLGDRESAFRSFVESKTGRFFRRRRQAPIRRLMQWMKKWENEAYHL